MKDLAWLLILAAGYAIVSLRIRDYYIVVREFRIVGPDDFGIGKTIESRHLHHFDDYSAAKAFFDLNESYGTGLLYENQQNINYVYAVQGLTAKMASRKMIKKTHYKARLLIKTPYSTLAAHKRHWDEERKARADLEPDAIVSDN